MHALGCLWSSSNPHGTTSKLQSWHRKMKDVWKHITYHCGRHKSNGGRRKLRDSYHSITKCEIFHAAFDNSRGPRFRCRETQNARRPIRFLPSSNQYQWTAWHFDGLWFLMFRICFCTITDQDSQYVGFVALLSNVHSAVRSMLICTCMVMGHAGQSLASCERFRCFVLSGSAASTGLKMQKHPTVRLQFWIHSALVLILLSLSG